MDEIAARLNSALRDQYGLARDVFYVERRFEGHEALALIDHEDEPAMFNFALTVEHLCAVFAEHDPRPVGQLRMF